MEAAMADSESKAAEFERAACGESSSGLIVEMFRFLEHNKKWWLLPLIAALLLMGGLVVISGSVLAPFIYTLF